MAIAVITGIQRSTRCRYLNSQHPQGMPGNGLLMGWLMWVTACGDRGDTGSRHLPWGLCSLTIAKATGCVSTPVAAASH